MHSVICNGNIYQECELTDIPQTENMTSLGPTPRGALNMQMTEDNGDDLFVPIAAGWLASRTDDYDDSVTALVLCITVCNPVILSV